MRGFGDRLQEPGAEVGQLLLPYPADAAQLRGRARNLAGHRAQDGVAEDDVRRDVAFGRDLTTERPQRGEDLAVVDLVVDGTRAACRPAAPPGDVRERLADL